MSRGYPAGCAHSGDGYNASPLRVVAPEKRYIYLTIYI